MKVLTIGTFDLLHRGHLNLFHACYKIAGQGGQVYVGVNTDEFVEKYKGLRPVQSHIDRWLVVSALRVVHAACDNRDNGVTLIRRIQPDVLVVGSDWAKKDYYAQIGITAEELEEQGTLLVYVPYTPGISSTSIKERLK